MEAACAHFFEENPFFAGMALGRSSRLCHLERRRERILNSEVSTLCDCSCDL